MAVDADSLVIENNMLSILDGITYLLAATAIWGFLTLSPVLTVAAICKLTHFISEPN